LVLQLEKAALNKMLSLAARSLLKLSMFNEGFEVWQFANPAIPKPVNTIISFKVISFTAID
jgi:hypothetical protein